MSIRSGTAAMTFVAFASAAAGIIYHRPYVFGAKISGGEAHPEVARYGEEFADLLSIAQFSNTGAPHVFLTGGDAVSPDKRCTLRQHELRNYYHEITLSRDTPGPLETVLILQESDPGSGTSHAWHWSSDSKAVFIYGSGTPAGHVRMNDLALVYLIETHKLYSLDLGPHLSKRLHLSR